MKIKNIQIGKTYFAHWWKYLEKIQKVICVDIVEGKKVLVCDEKYRDIFKVLKPKEIIAEYKNQKEEKKAVDDGTEEQI